MLINFPEVLVTNYMYDILLSCLSNQYLKAYLHFMINKLKGQYLKFWIMSIGYTLIYHSWGFSFAP